jgi:ABC-2 type transport system permease protein
MKYIREVWAARELLVFLTLREVKGKYKRTVFGQLWSLANPLAAMLIYTLVFAFIIRVTPDPGNPSGLNVFALWLLCGLLPWTFFSQVLNAGLSSIVDNASLIQKVYFTRIVLPLSLVASVSFNWLFEMGVLLVVLVIFGAFVWPFLPLLILIMILLVIFAAGVALLLSVANVYFRDTQYFTTILLQIWMYLTPIIYPGNLVDSLSKHVGGLAGTPITIGDLYRLNPMEHFVAVFRQLLYDNRLPDGGDFLTCAIWAIATAVIGVLVFHRVERKLAETL